MDYKAATDYLYGLQKFGIKFGLDNTVRLLYMLGNPQDSFKAIHIAGTNGKGSTSAMLASMLKAAGFSVGLFTSPHLVSFTERIRVNDAEIEEKEVIELTSEIKEVMDSSQDMCKNPESKIQNPKLINPTFFEFITAMAFLHFKRKGIEWAVIETGMGGRLDATNVVRPAVSVITRINYDHMEFLGQTLKDIALEKAGIIKTGIPIVSHKQEPEAMEVITKSAAEKKAPLFVYGKDFTANSEKADMQGNIFEYNGNGRLAHLYVPLCGLHQLENASAAIKVMELIMGEGSVSYGQIREGLLKTEWPGRLELIKKPGCNYDILLDGAHNPEAAKTLAKAVHGYFSVEYDAIILILGIMADKDMAGIMRPLLPLASEIIMTAPDYGRAAAPLTLTECALSSGFKARPAGSVREALESAARAAKGSGCGSQVRKKLILITGSFYTIGEAKTILGQQNNNPSLAGLR